MDIAPGMIVFVFAPSVVVAAMTAGGVKEWTMTVQRKGMVIGARPEKRAECKLLHAGPRHAGREQALTGRYRSLPGVARNCTRRRMVAHDAKKLDHRD